VTELERKISTLVTLKSAERGLAVARFSTPDGVTVDRDGDITLKGAFQEGAKAIISPWGHTSVTAGSIPAGRATIHADGTASLKFFLSTEVGRSTYESVKELADIVEFSYGFHVTEGAAPTAEQRAAGARRVLKSLRVYEVSPVVMGAGISTGLLAIKASPPAPPDPALVREVKRFQAFAECMKEPHGALAWDVAQCSARWMSNGRVQEGPAVKWFDPDGRRAGFWVPGADEIHLSRGLSWNEVIRVTAHEAAGHWWHNWDSSEATAKQAEKYVERRYHERLAA